MTARRDTTDYQRAKVYRWENQHIHPKGGEPIPFDQAQGIVNYVWLRRGLTYPPMIEPLNRGSKCTLANATRLRIRIPAGGISTTILLHEIAHSMTTDAATDYTHAHRPRFVGTFMQLLCDLIPTFRLNRLMESAVSAGVEFDIDKPNGAGQ